MALLSNQDTLFKQLNLVSNKNNKNKQDLVPSDFYNFLLHKLTNVFKNKQGENIEEEDSKGSYHRLNNFISTRSHLKKSIITIPYNCSTRAMKKYIADSLVKLDCNKDKTNWYCVSETNTKQMINDKDLYLLISCLKSIIENDFVKIKKLSKYLKNIALLLNLL